MRTAKAAAVVLLFVLIPHQAPYAESGDGAAAAQRLEPSGQQSEQPSSPEAVAPTRRHAGGQVAAEKEADSTSAKAPERRQLKAVDTDGYSLSARSLR
jgi:hypothetical protein